MLITQRGAGIATAEPANNAIASASITNRAAITAVGAGPIVGFFPQPIRDAYSW